MPNFVNPEPAHFGQLKLLPMDQSVQMLNLVKLRDRADYEDGADTTGRKAYDEYGRLSAPVFNRVGGRIIWSGQFEFMVIGPKDEHWDIAFVAEYPTGQAFMDMVFDPEYQAIVYHRTAAVETSRLIRLQANESGAGFG